jgi:hypothetical protein
LNPNDTNTRLLRSTCYRCKGDLERSMQDVEAVSDQHRKRHELSLFERNKALEAAEMRAVEEAAASAHKEADASQAVVLGRSRKRLSSRRFSKNSTSSRGSALDGALSGSKPASTPTFKRIEEPFVEPYEISRQRNMIVRETKHQSLYLPL